MLHAASTTTHGQANWTRLLTWVVAALVRIYAPLLL